MSTKQSLFGNAPLFHNLFRIHRSVCHQVGGGVVGGDKGGWELTFLFLYPLFDWGSSYCSTKGIESSSASLVLLQKIIFSYITLSKTRTVSAGPNAEIYTTAAYTHVRRNVGLLLDTTYAACLILNFLIWLLYSIVYRLPPVAIKKIKQKPSSSSPRARFPFSHKPIVWQRHSAKHAL